MNRLPVPKMFILLILIWSNVHACTRDELEMVQIISKHGSFAPSFVYPKDPNPTSVWTEGLNDITMLGKFEAYALGALLRSFYGDFITSDPRELEVFSSSDKGVVKSTQSLVTALYTPNPDWEVVQNFSWQPIYIKYDNDYDKFLSKRICPSTDAEYERIIFSETESLLQTYQNLILHWSTKSGMNLKNIIDVEELFRVLLTELSHNLTIPEWAQLYWNELKYLHDVSVSLRTKSLKLKRLKGGPFVAHLNKAMTEKSISSQDPRKIIVYSTHTISMQGLLAAMDLGKFEYLPPCATLLLELYNTEGVYFVRYLFWNSTLPRTQSQKMYSLIVPGCSQFCPLNYVIEYTKDIIPKDWDKECLLI